VLRLEIRVERHLGVDGDRLAAGQVHHEIGPCRAAFGGELLLHLEIDVLDHAGCLDDAPQLRLAPEAAGVVRAQSRREILRRAPQLLLGTRGLPQLLGQLAVLRDALLLHVRDGVLQLAQAVAQRRELLQHALLFPVQLGSLLRVRVRVPQPLFEPLHAGLCGGELFAQQACARFGVESRLLHRE
jgi:hypothetical protein